MNTSPSFLRILLLSITVSWCGMIPALAKKSSVVSVGNVAASGKTYRAGSSLTQNAVISTDTRTPAEVVTASDATLRLGRATSASVSKGKAQLFRGSVLLSSAKGILGRRSEDVVAGATKVACNGSVLIATTVDTTKVTCLEGNATVRLNGRRGQFLQLPPGSMVMLEGETAELPQPVEVDLSRLTRTTGLLSAPFGELRSQKGIRRAIARQQRAIAKGKLLASSVTVSGSGGETSVGGDSPSNGGQSDSASGGSSSGGSSSGGSSSGGGGGSGSSGGGAVASTGGSLSSACA